MLAENFDAIVYELADGDLSRSVIIENIDVENVLSYLLLKRIKDLNEKRWKIAELDYYNSLSK